MSADLLLALLAACLLPAANACLLFYLNVRYWKNNPLVCLLACLSGGPLVWAVVVLYTLRELRKRAALPPAPAAKLTAWTRDAHQLLLDISRDNQDPNGQTSIREDHERRLNALLGYQQHPTPH